MDSSKAAARAAAKTGVDPKSVHNLVAAFEESGGVITTKARAERGAGEDSLLPETQAQIELWIHALQDKGKPVVGTDLARWLRSEPLTNTDAGEGGNTGGSSAEGTSIPDYDVDRVAIEVSDATVRRWLRKMGYRMMEEKTGYQVTEERTG